MRKIGISSEEMLKFTNSPLSKIVTEATIIPSLKTPATYPAGGREEMPQLSNLLTGNPSTQPIDSHAIHPSLSHEWFLSKIESSPSQSTANSLRQALSSFMRYRAAASLSKQDFLLPSLSEWASWLFFDGYSKKTIIFYVKSLSSLYSKAVAAGIAPQSEAFSLLISRIKELPEQSAELNIDPSTFDKLRALIRRDFSSSPTLTLAKDMLLFSIFAGGLSFEQLSTFTKDPEITLPPAAEEIKARYSKPKNKYLFPLEQSKRTPRQLSAHLSTLFSLILGQVGLRNSNPPTETAPLLWTICAVRAGLSPLLAAAHALNRPSHPAFLLPQPKEAQASNPLPINVQFLSPWAKAPDVARVLLADPTGWYAMQFRPKVKYEEITSRLKKTESAPLLSAVFYPQEEIARRIGHKIAFANRPIVNGLLFFRSRSSELTPLFHIIGDLAWGYRQTRDHLSPYAVIPDWEIARYQRAIGSFTPDTVLQPVGSIKLSPGDRLQIIGGKLAGKTARFESQTTNEDGTTVCRLIMIGDNGFEWRVNSDPRLLKKI